MFVHPQFDPIAISLGPVAVRWYGLMYLVAFILFVLLGRLHARRRPELGWDAQQIDDLLFYGPSLPRRSAAGASRARPSQAHARLAHPCRTPWRVGTDCRLLQ